jgi:SAM-dependent methyltransferase
MTRKQTPLLRAAMLGFVVVILVGPATHAYGDPQPYQEVAPSRDGIGKVYMGREISQVMGHRGAGWLERLTRESEERPAILIQAMSLAPDAVVADIGAGTGYFSFRLSQKVPEGRVLAVDIQPEMLSIMRDRIAAGAAENVVPVLGAIDDPNLPPDTIDAVLMVDAYHEFSHPWEMMQGIVRAMRSGGQVYLVEYRGEDLALPIKPLHKMTEAQARREMAAVGPEWVETLDVLPTQHLMVFRKP